MILALLGACSLSTLDHEPCDSDATCRTAFGWGTTCGENGFCKEIEPDPRCERTVPEDLATAREDYTTSTLLGAVGEASLWPLEIDALELAISQVNESDTMLDHPLALFVCHTDIDSRLDDLGAAEASVAMAKHLAQEMGVPAIIGTTTSEHTEAIFGALEDLGTLVISPSASSVALTDLDGMAHSDELPGLLWRTLPPEDLQGRVLGDLLTKTSGTTAIAYRSGSYGQSIMELAQIYASGDPTVLEFTDEGQRSLAITALGDHDAVLFISPEANDYVTFLNIAGQDPRYADIAIFLPDAALDSAILDATPQGEHLFDQITLTQSAAPSGRVYDEFASAFNDTFGKDPGLSRYTANAYDAAWMLAYGVTWASLNELEVSGIAMARGLRELSSGRRVDVGPNDVDAVRSTFEQGQGIDITGASGELDYDSTNEETSAPIDVYVIKDMAFVRIDTVD